MTTKLEHVALRTTLLYVAVGGLWILFSDRALRALAGDDELFAQWQTYKGWAYVGVTGLLIYFELRRGLERWNRERSQREAAVAERLRIERQLSQFSEVAPDVMYTFHRDRAGRFTFPFANHRIEEFTGIPVEKLAEDGTPALALVHPDDLPRVIAAIEESARVLAPFREEFRLCHPQGSIRWLEGHTMPLREADGSTRWHGFMRDTTERKKLEQQFLRAQRLEGIGTLAGGIAHDLNNALSPILVSLELLEMKFPDADSQEILATLRGSAQRGADMVRQVLTYARGVDGRRVPVPISRLMGEVAKIASETFPKHLRLEFAPGKNLASIIGDPTQLHQVLLNLCVNARDAMPEGGTLSLSAENVRVTEGDEAGGVAPGDYVCLAVADTGCGISPELMEKIFDPFFTTKEIGKGTGLGLSTSAAIVKSHGGFIRVESEPGRGARFRVFLPVDEEPIEEPEAAEPSHLPRGNGELILVVDDEESVRKAMRRMLETFGYRVTTAANGAEAVAIHVREGRAIDAVITDMMMPVLDGAATIRALHAAAPELPIVATSGIGFESAKANAASFGVFQVLPKPCSAPAVLGALKQALEPREKTQP